MQAVDQHLVYSEPATVTLNVEPDPQLVALQTEITHLRSEVSRKYDFGNIVGRSEAIRKVRRLMELAIDSGLDVLITGETGTGKELVAKGIHYNSSRGNKAPVELDCGTLTEELASSELFGHCKGAFTGADEDKVGLFEAADGSTLILDEISNMPLEIQRKLLRVLEEREVLPIGETIPRDVDVQVIAMTNLDLQKEMEAGRFREDLYYRLCEFQIPVPPLRERREDIPLLADHFLRESDKEIDGLGPGVYEMLQNYHWPGNIRELRNAVHRAYVLAEAGSPIQLYHFSSRITQKESPVQEVLSEQLSYSESLDQLRRRLVGEALRQTGGNRTQAARLLGMDVANLRRLIRKLMIH